MTTVHGKFSITNFKLQFGNFKFLRELREKVSGAGGVHYDIKVFNAELKGEEEVIVSFQFTLSLRNLFVLSFLGSCSILCKNKNSKIVSNIIMSNLRKNLEKNEKFLMFFKTTVLEVCKVHVKMIAKIHNVNLVDVLN